jgi:hypothetical protein
MKIQHRVVRATAFVSGISLLFAGAACRKKTSTITRTADTSLIALDQGLASYPGANPDATKAYLQKLTFVTDSMVDGPVTCASGDDCGGAASVHLRILPEANAHRDDITATFAAAGNAGFIMAMIINADSSHKFGPFGLAAGDTAYMWAGPTKSSGKVFGFYKINRTTGEAQGLAKAGYGAYCAGSGPRTIPAVHIPMYQCQSTPLYGNAATASGTGRNTSAALYRLASNPIFAATMLHTQGLWISCSSGCCQAGSIVESPLM